MDTKALNVAWSIREQAPDNYMAKWQTCRVALCDKGEPSPVTVPGVTELAMLDRSKLQEGSLPNSEDGKEEATTAALLLKNRIIYQG